MEIRQAKAEELPYLQTRLDEYRGGEVDRLDRARCFVAVENGKPIGIFPLHLVWQGGPLYIFPECKVRAARRRAGFLLFHSACEWLSDKSLNRSGVRWLFAVVRKRAVHAWAPRIGLLRQYRGAAIYTKCLGD